MTSVSQKIKLVSHFLSLFYFLSLSLFFLSFFFLLSSSSFSLHFLSLYLNLLPFFLSLSSADGATIEVVRRPRVSPYVLELPGVVDIVDSTARFCSPASWTSWTSRAIKLRNRITASDSTDLKELWADAPIGMTKPGWDQHQVDEEEVEVISDEIREGRDLPIDEVNLAAADAISGSGFGNGARS